MIRVEHVAGLATVQDLGRPGSMHEGLAVGGALVPEMLIDANRQLGNPDHAPAIEVFGRIRLNVDGIERQLESGPLRVIYIAVRDGIPAELVAGGRGTQLSAGIGAPLRAGDRIATTNEIAVSRFVVDDAPILVIPGPDEVPDALFTSDFKISGASNRVGTRLDGPVLPALTGTGVSRPMVRGAIELPPDGHPIVLGPEHPTTGGYPVIAVVATASQAQLFARPIGARIRFTRSAGAAR